MTLFHPCGGELGAALALVSAETLRAIVAVAVGLTLIILAHEWGHFIVARALKVRVEVFSILGIGPRLFGWKHGDTDYRFSMFPIGAYVKLAGESSEEERAGAPDEFLSKARWQRALILAAGPVMNIVCAVVMFFLVFWAYGLPEASYLAKPPVLAGVLKDSPAEKAGLRPGDLLTQVNGAAVSTWRDVARAFDKSAGHTEQALAFERGGSRLEAAVTANPAVQRPSEIVGYPDEPVRIEGVFPGSPADKAGLEAGDDVATADDRPVVSVDQFVETLQQSAGRPVNLGVLRNGRKQSISVQAHLDTLPDGTKKWRIGVQPGPSEVHYRQLGLPEAASFSVAETGSFAVRLLQGIWQLVVGQSSLRELQGPVGIAHISGQAAQQGLPEFLTVLGFISLNLAIVNFLPIPILDGGHLLLLLLEGLRRRDFSLVFRERFLQLGMVFLLLVFAIVMYNDVRRLIPPKWLG